MTKLVTIGSYLKAAKIHNHCKQVTNPNKCCQQYFIPTKFNNILQNGKHKNLGMRFNKE